MQFEIDKKQILEALKAVAPAVAKRSSLPILQGVRVEACDTEVTLQGTDLEVAISTRTDAISIPTKGVAVVEAQQLKKAVEALEGPALLVETRGKEGNEVGLSSGLKSIALRGLSANDWPTMANASDKAPVCSMPATVLCQGLSKVVICASQDEARPVLTGVQFTFKPDAQEVELVATDSYRLGTVSIPAELPTGSEHTVIVPARVIKAMAKHQAKQDGEVRITVTDLRHAQASQRLVEFSFGQTNWLVREIEGEFPNWRQLIPAHEGGMFAFDSAELSRGIKDAAALRSSKQDPVRIDLNEGCALRIVDGQSVVLRQELEKANYSPNGIGPMEIAFNPDFLRDALAFVGQEQGAMWAKDPTKPALFQNGQGRYVLMPVRLPA